MHAWTLVELDDRHVERIAPERRVLRYLVTLSRLAQPDRVIGRWVVDVVADAPPRPEKPRGFWDEAR